MRRKEQASEDRRRRWMQVAIGLFIISIMVLSIVQIADNSNGGQRLAFNGYDFVSVKGGIGVKGVEGLVLESFPVERNGTSYLFQNIYGGLVTLDAAPGLGPAMENASYLVLTFDPAASPEKLQLLDYVRSELSKRITLGSAKNAESQTYPGLPVIACSQAGNGAVIVELSLRNDTYNNATITRNGDCFTVTADPYGLIVVKDYLLLLKNGVIDDG